MFRRLPVNFRTIRFCTRNVIMFAFFYVVKVLHTAVSCNSRRFVRLRQGYGGTAFGAFRALRLVCATGLPSRKKIRQGILPDFRRLVGVIELESMTSTMSTWRSNQLSYNPLRVLIIHKRGKNASLFFKNRSASFLSFDSCHAESLFGGGFISCISLKNTL